MFDKEENFEAKKPNFVSNKGVMVWKNKDKNNNDYLSIKIPILNISVNCFELKGEEIEAN